MKLETEFFVGIGVGMIAVCIVEVIIITIVLFHVLSEKKEKKRWEKERTLFIRQQAEKYRHDHKLDEEKTELEFQAEFEHYFNPIGHNLGMYCNEVKNDTFR